MSDLGRGVSGDLDLTLDNKLTTAAIWTISHASECFNGRDYQKIESKTFGKHSQWKLGLSVRDKGPERQRGLGVRLVAVLSDSDYDDSEGDTGENWDRPGLFSIVCKVSLSGDPDINRSVSKRSFCSPALVLKSKLTKDTVASLRSLLVEGNNTIRVAVTITRHSTVPAPASLPISDPVGNLLVIFDDAKSANVVFTFPDKRQIFASREILESQSEYFREMFSSGFSESSHMVLIDVAGVARSVDHSRYDEDDDDISPFVMFLDETSPRKPKRAKVNHDSATVSNARSDNLRSMREVKVTSDGYNTYRVLLAYLYTRILPLTSSPSDYAVALYAASDAHATSSEPFLFEAPGEWLRDDYELSTGSSSLHGISPCSPHALYRLADRYGLSELCKEIRAHIVGNLTVENVMYELFSPLSVMHKVVQDEIFAFFVANRQRVHETTAWGVFEQKLAQGELVHAQQLVSRLFARFFTDLAADTHRGKRKK